MPILNTISIKNASSEYNRTTTVIVFDVIPLPPTVIINNHSNISAVDLVPISTWYHHSPTNHVVRVVWIGVRIDGGDLIESFRLYDCNFLFTTLDHFFASVFPFPLSCIRGHTCNSIFWKLYCSQSLDKLRAKLFFLSFQQSGCAVFFMLVTR